MSTPTNKPATQAPTVAPTAAPTVDSEQTSKDYKDYNMFFCVAILISAIGALNWLLVAQFNINLVDQIFGVNSELSKIVYTLVGLAGVVCLFFLAKCAMKKYN